MTKQQYRKLNRFFVTFPQSGDIEPEDIFKLWGDSDYHFKELTWVVEKHEDGGNHIHWAFELKHKLTKMQVLDKFMCVYPDDYQRIKVESGRQTIQSIYDGYFKKEGVPYYKNYKPVKSLWTEAEQLEWDRIGREIENDKIRSEAIRVAKSLEEPTFAEWLHNEEQWEKLRSPDWEWVEDIYGGSFIRRE